MSYRQVNSKLWTGEVMLALRGDTDALVVLFYILTGPESCSSSIGVFRLSVGAIADAVGIPFERCADAVRRVCDTGFAFYDEPFRMWHLTEAARHRYGDEPNPSRNELKGLISSLPGLVAVSPKSLAWKHFHDRYAAGWAPIFDAAGVAFERRPDAVPTPSGTRDKRRREEEKKRDTPPPPADGGPAPDGALPPVPKWATDAAKGTNLTGRKILEEVCDCVEAVHGRPPDPGKVKTSADPILKLWRALGRPDDFFDDFQLVAQASHDCGAKIFARDIRAEGWTDGTDRQFRVATIARQEPWAERVAIAKAWRDAGRPAPRARAAQDNRSREERRLAEQNAAIMAPANVPAIDVRARLEALAERIPETMATTRNAILELTGDVEGIEEALSRLERQALDSLPDHLGHEVMAEISGKRDAHVLRLRSRMGPDKLATAGREILEKLMRDRAGLPELSLFAPEAT